MIINITVKPGSSQNKIIASPSGLIIYTSKRTHDNEANLAVIKALADFYHVSKSCILIKSGIKSRHKVIEIIKPAEADK